MSSTTFTAYRGAEPYRVHVYDDGPSLSDHHADAVRVITATDHAPRRRERGLTALYPDAVTCAKRYAGERGYAGRQGGWIYSASGVAVAHGWEAFAGLLRTRGRIRPQMVGTLISVTPHGDEIVSAAYAWEVTA